MIRFCKVLGFKGYSDFKIRLAKELGADNQEPVPIGINRSDTPVEVVKKVLLLEAQDINYTLDMLDPKELSKCLNYINSANNLAFFGFGSSSNVANIAKDHFLNFGKKAFAETESLAQIALANSLGKDDVAFIISISGESHLTLEISRIAKNNGAKTICLTQNPTSRLSISCDCSLICYRKSGLLDDLGTVSRTVNSSIIAAIAIACITMDWDNATTTVAKNRQKFRELQFSGTANIS
jgi:RpiR family carbohydrate utilization transcriptional regulator